MHSQVAPNPPWPQDVVARWPWMGLRGHEPIKAVQGILTALKVSPDPPWPQDGAASWPWSGLWGHAPPKAVQGISTGHMSHLTAL